MEGRESGEDVSCADDFFFGGGGGFALLFSSTRKA